MRRTEQNNLTTFNFLGNNSMKTVFSQALLGNLLLIGAIACTVGCNQGNMPSAANPSAERPVTQSRPSGTFWEAVQNDDWSLMRRWIEYDQSLVNSSGMYTDHISRRPVGTAPRVRTGFTPLRLAIMRGNLEMVKFLCENGADMTMQSSIGETALHYVASLGDTGNNPAHVDILKYLIDRGSNVNARTSEGLTPLDHLGMFDINNRGMDRRSLHAAGNDMIRILTEAGGRRTR